MKSKLYITRQKAQRINALVDTAASVIVGLHIIALAVIMAGAQ
jgi:hypothetical protein